MDKNKIAMISALRLLADEIENDKVTILETKLENDGNYWNIGYKDGLFLCKMKRIEIAYIDNDKQLPTH
jgi:hypothetical protein